jgi:hypothetical protein
LHVCLTVFPICFSHPARESWLLPIISVHTIPLTKDQFWSGHMSNFWSRMCELKHWGKWSRKDFLS